MLDDGVWRGVCVHGRVGTARRMYLQCRLRIHIDDDHVVCDYYWHLLDDRLRRWVRVRGRRSASNPVYLQRRLSIYIDGNNIVRG